MTEDEPTNPAAKSWRTDRHDRPCEPYMQRRRAVQRRAWQRALRMSWFDPGKPPLTVLRWLGILGLALAWWARGAATSPRQTWVPYVVIAGVLILPDVAGFAIGGFKLSLKQAQDDIARLRLEVNNQARASAMLNIGDSAIAAAFADVAKAAPATRDAISGEAEAGNAQKWQRPQRPANPKEGVT